MIVLVSTEACEAGDNLADGNIVHIHGGLRQNLVEAALTGCNVFLVIDIDGRRTNQGVAVDGRSYQDSLAVFGGLRENGMFHESARGLVQQEVVAAARGDMNLLFAYHVVEIVGIEAGCIDHTLCLIFAVGGPKMPDALFVPAELLDVGVEEEVHAVYIRVLRHGDIQLKRADDACGLGIECALYVVGQVGLHRLGFVSA